MSRISSRDIQLHVRYGEIQVSMIAEGVSWSPDAANDLVNRVAMAWDNTLASLYEHGLLEVDEEDDDYGPVPDKELMDPRIVTLEDNDG